MSDQCRVHGPPAIAQKFLLSLVVAFQYICVYRIISIFTRSESGNRVSSCSRVRASSQGPRPCHHPGDPWRCVRKYPPFPPRLPLTKSRRLLRTRFPRTPLAGSPPSPLGLAAGPSRCHRQTAVPASFPRHQSVEAHAVSPRRCRHPYSPPRVTPG